MQSRYEGSHTLVPKKQVAEQEKQVREAGALLQEIAREIKGHMPLFEDKVFGLTRENDSFIIEVSIKKK